MSEPSSSVSTRIYAASHEAMQLALAVADQVALNDKQRERVEPLRTLLNGLANEAAGDRDASLAMIISEGLVDLDYVRTAGKGVMSLRLAALRPPQGLSSAPRPTSGPAAHPKPAPKSSSPRLHRDGTIT